MTDSEAGLVFASGEPFATGAARYLDHPPEAQEPLARIYVKFIPEGTKLQFIALLDTGGHYCILNDNVVQEIGDLLTDKIGEAELTTAHGVLRGDLFLHRITLVAEIGTPLDIDGLIFVVPGWQGPSFIGYTGALDRVCFAIRPRDNMIFFGSSD